MPKRIAITAVLLAALLVSLAASRVTSQPSEHFSALTAEAEARGTVRVIVHLETPFVPEDQLPTPAHIQVQRQEIARVRALVQAGLRGTQHRVVREYDALPFLALEVGPEALRVLQSLQGVVVHVERDELAAPMLAESVPLIQGHQAWALGFDGTGQIVAILDSGVEKNHPFLAGKVVGEACFSSTDVAFGSTSVCPGGASSSTAPDSALPCDPGVLDCDHGTNVAGIAAGGTGAAGSGVAKGAKILAIQVFSRIDDDQVCSSSPCALSFTSDQLAALNHVFNVRSSFPGLNVAAVNMSVAGPAPLNCDSDSRKAAIDQLRGAGIATTLPAGNGGFVNFINAPACISTAVSVGATLDGTANPPATPVDTVAPFSNTAASLSLLAPGQSITSSAPDGTFNTNFAGTSQASAHVAGAFAILRQASPHASVGTILQALQDTGLPISDTRADPAIVKPRINIRDAITAPALNPIQVVWFSAGLYTVSEATATATITLKRSGAAALIAQTAFTVPVTVTPGTAVPGVDYVVPLGPPLGTVTVAFAKGQTTASFTIKLLNDTLVDGDRLVNLTLGTPTNSVLTPTNPVLKGAPDKAVLKITSNDQGGVMKFALAGYSVNEGGTVVVTVMRTGTNLASGVTVDFAVTDVTAFQGTDFNLANGTLTFGAGQTSKTISIPTVRDFLVGPAKTFLLTLSHPLGGGAVIAGPLASTTVTIKNIDVGGIMQFSSAASSVFENVAGGTFNLTVKRTGTNLAGSVTVDYAVTGGTAVNNTDYVLANGTVTFGPGQTSKPIAVTINDDVLINLNRTVVVTLSNPLGGGVLGTIKVATLTIVDDEQAVKFSAGLYTVSEATATATITLKRTGAPALVAQTAFTVPVTVTPDTAVPGRDYVAPAVPGQVPGQVTVAFAKAQTTATFTIPLLNDTIVDVPGDRLVNLTLGTPTSPVLKGPPDTAVLKLTNNDQGGVMKFALATSSVNEGATAVVTVMRTGINLASGVSVDFAVTGGSAVRPADFILADGTLTFLAGQTSKTISIPTVRDFLVGPAKTIQLTLSNALGGGAVIAGPGASTTVNINNIDTGGSMQFSSATSSVFENVPGGTFNLTVTRTGTNLAGSVTVDYAVTGGTAVNGVDYVLANGTVTFGPGQTSKPIAVTINDDLLINGNRTVVVTLSNPLGGGLLGTIKVATLTIVDNDALVQFALASDQVLESLVSKIYTVTRSGGSTPVSVHWSASIGGISTGESGTLNFTAIQTSATITIPIAAHFSNLTPDVDRTLTLTLDTPGGGAQIGPNNPLNVTVHDDDVAFTAPAEQVVSKGQFFTLSFCQPDRDNSSLCGGLAATTNVSGGQPPYHFVKSAGLLPLGLTLHPNGNVDGTPTGVPGRYKFTLCAIDLAGKQSCKPTSILMVGIDGAYTGAFSGADDDTGEPVTPGAVAFTVTTTNGVNGTVQVSKPSAATGTVTGLNPPLTFGAIVTQGVTCGWTGGFTVNSSTGAVHANGNWNCVIPPALGGGTASGIWTADKPAPLP